ncbi:MAG: ribosome assembly RNA-binding protein YhbY [Thermoanaerobaculia bacterium]
MALTSRQRKHLKALAHHLEPTVKVGQRGLTSPLLAEAHNTLEAHELIKVRVDSGPAERHQIATALAGELGAELVETIGKIAILYRRRSENPKIELP